MNEVTIRECLQLLDRRGCAHRFRGDENVELNRARKIDELVPGAVGFYKKPDILRFQHLYNGSNLVLFRSDCPERGLPEGNYIFADDPHLAFIFIARMLVESDSSGIDTTSVVHPDAVLSPSVFIGAFSYIGSEVTIGDHSKVYEQCTLKNRVRIGENVIVQSGCTLGNPGLGSIKDQYGIFHDFPHFGDIVIGDDVTIGDGTVVYQGSLNTTTIGDGCKLGAQVFIGPGATVGENCFIGVGATLLGSVVVGPGSWIAPGCIIRDGLNVGREVTIGMGAVVTKHVPDGETWYGVPANRR